MEIILLAFIFLATLFLAYANGANDNFKGVATLYGSNTADYKKALVLERDILLLDEPLASLDAKLRKDMCIELKRIQEKIGITFIHVTHNQEEAMTIADRIAIIADGELVEEGTPREIYERPVRRFTASFVGENNLLDGRVVVQMIHL